MMIYYHGSKISNIKVFKPQAHIVVDGRSVVFATHDKAYALAMIHASGAELAVSYAINPDTKRREMYIDELEDGKLKELEKPGSLYEFDGKYFSPSLEGLEGEFVSETEVPVLREEKIANIGELLRSMPGIHLVKYSDVPGSMSKRIKDRPMVVHAEDRFQK